MALFDYQAANAQGRIEKGQLDADSPRSARQLLRGRGLTPVQVRAARAAGSGGGARRLSASELAWATRHAVMSSEGVAGVSISGACLRPASIAARMARRSSLRRNCHCPSDTRITTAMPSRSRAATV
ncbi:hypothetical protein G6F50_018024 [Rhizopus delemar]|uniref:Uncharacterized protein n=1 Tax=Rhizopus delemar TaxID=936053 RepID=A0A9P6XPE5_9FUNG|nr:hypothetical protein G6F50_018024 [Rhizopus delemar]